MKSLVKLAAWWARHRISIHKRRWHSVLILLAVSAVGSVFLMQGNILATPSGNTITNEQPIELDSVDVTVAAEGPIGSSLAISGILQPLRQSVLTAETEGRVKEVFVRVGEMVRTGEILAKMGTRDLESYLAEQRANLAVSRANFALAEKSQGRNAKLLARNFISQASVDNSLSALDASRESMKAREAQFALAQQALAKAVIRSPFNGIVAEQLVDPGQHVPLNTKLFVIVDMDELIFAANVPITEVSAVRIGQSVTLNLEGGKGLVTGQVERIAPTADPMSRMIPVYIRVPNQEGHLKGGMIVRGRVQVEADRRALVVSTDVLRRDGEKHYVLRLAGEKIERQEVALGIVDAASGRVEILSGLTVGDKILLARISGMLPGQRVSLVRNVFGSQLN